MSRGSHSGVEEHDCSLNRRSMHHVSVHFCIELYHMIDDGDSSPFTQSDLWYHDDFVTEMWKHRTSWVYFFTAPNVHHEHLSFEGRLHLYLSLHDGCTVCLPGSNTGKGHIAEVIISWYLFKELAQSNSSDLTCPDHAEVILNRRHLLTHLEEHHRDLFDVWRRYNHYSYDHAFTKKLSVLTFIATFESS